MRRLRSSLFACVRLAIPAFFFAVTACAGEAQIEGQVFIATKGGENFKLGLVPVGLYPADQMREYLAAKDQAFADRVPKIEAITREASRMYEKAAKLDNEAFHAHLDHPENKALTDAYYRFVKVKDGLYEDYQDWSSVLYCLRSGGYYFASLPNAVANAKSDADGKFTCAVPSRGDWVLAATASRSVGSERELYYWLVKVRVGAESTKVMLANDNLLDSGSVESFITAHCDSVRTARGVRLLPRVDEFIAKAEQKAKEDQAVAAAREEQERQTKAAAAAALEERTRAARLPQLVKESQARALKAHPDLATAGSAINKAFVDRYKTFQAEKNPRLQEPDWPEKLADECARTTETVANH